MAIINKQLLNQMRDLIHNYTRREFLNSKYNNLYLLTLIYIPAFFTHFTWFYTMRCNVKTIFLSSWKFDEHRLTSSQISVAWIICGFLLDHFKMFFFIKTKRCTADWARGYLWKSRYTQHFESCNFIARCPKGNCSFSISGALSRTKNEMIKQFFTPFRDEIRVQNISLYRVLSRDVTSVILTSLSKGTAANYLVSPATPPGIELCSYANVFSCFGWKACSLITWVKTLYWDNPKKEGKESLWKESSTRWHSCDIRTFQRIPVTRRLNPTIIIHLSKIISLWY